MNIWSSSAKWRDFKWESSGTAEFSWVWAFKFMILIFAALMFIVAISFLLRNILALLEKDEDIPSHFSFAQEGASSKILSRNRFAKNKKPSRDKATIAEEDTAGHGV
jgi:hypothetical protein